MELYAREFGQGNPVIILHGLFGFSDNWQTIAKGLSDQYLVVTPDLRNHGRSPHVPGHSYPEMAEDILEFMQAHWMFSAALIGHSMGGKVAMQLALSHPDAVEKLIVVDIEPGQAEDNHTDIFQALTDLDLPTRTSRQEVETFLADRIPDLGTRQFLIKNITRNEDSSFRWKMNLPVLWQHFPEILGPVTGDPFLKPTLFIRGSRSNYIQDSDFPGIRKLFPNSQVITIQDAGHWVHADQPVALLNALKAFLA